jgi:hypothetical protein
VAGKTYSVIYRDDLTTGDWFLLRHVAAPPVSRRVDLFDANATPTRFYRLVTPRR